MPILNQIVGQQPFLTTQVQPHPLNFAMPHAPDAFWDPKPQQAQQPQGMPGGGGVGNMPAPKPDQQGHPGAQLIDDIVGRISGPHHGALPPGAVGVGPGAPGAGGAGGAGGGVMNSIMQSFMGGGGGAGSMDIAKLMAMMG